MHSNTALTSRRRKDGGQSTISNILQGDVDSSNKNRSRVMSFNMEGKPLLDSGRPRTPPKAIDASHSIPTLDSRERMSKSGKSGLLLCTVLCFIWAVEAWCEVMLQVDRETSHIQSISPSTRRTSDRIGYRPEFRKTVMDLMDPCQHFPHKFEFQNGKVKWYAPLFMLVPQHRPYSMHCLMARAAKRLGPTFSANVVIGVGDAHSGANLTFGPAALEEEMSSSPFPPLLFPDSSFESWPEIKDYNVYESMQVVSKAAKKYGLPGTKKWITERDPRVGWRGSPGNDHRMEIINSSSPLLDVVGLKKTRYFELQHSHVKVLSRPEFCKYRFLLHTNGVSQDTYSSSLKWKFLCGSLVFVPTNPLIVEWWNYQTWEPYKHYVPYTNLEDLLQRVEYYNMHLDEAARIAQHGMEIAITAFVELNNFVDDSLLRYAEATQDVEDPVCNAFPNSSSWTSRAFIFQNKTIEPGFKSLEDLQKEYGPTVCS